MKNYRIKLKQLSITLLYKSERKTRNIIHKEYLTVMDTPYDDRSFVERINKGIRKWVTVMAKNICKKIIKRRVYLYK